MKLLEMPRLAETGWTLETDGAGAQDQGDFYSCLVTRWLRKRIS